MESGLGHGLSLVGLEQRCGSAVLMGGCVGQGAEHYVRRTWWWLAHVPTSDFHSHSRSHVDVDPILFLGCFERHQQGFGGGFAR